MKNPKSEIPARHREPEPRSGEAGGLNSKQILIALISLLALWPLTLASVPRPQDGVIAIFNTHTGERASIKYKDENGNYIPSGLIELDHILRCRLTGTTTDMSPGLIELVDTIQDHFGSPTVEVISGYRSPRLNSFLKTEGRRVVLGSLHMSGEAIDIRLKGVGLAALRNYARSLKVGGVGYYPGPGFVHVDVGPVRHW